MVTVERVVVGRRRGSDKFERVVDTVVFRDFLHAQFIEQFGAFGPVVGERQHALMPGIGEFFERMRTDVFHGRLVSQVPRPARDD